MVENGRDDSDPPVPLPLSVLQELEARVERSARRPYKSTTNYLAASLNEQRHARRVGRHLGLGDDEIEALVLWHSNKFHLHNRASRPPNPPSSLTYRVSVRRLPQTRTARLGYSVRRSPAVSWLPSFTINRSVELRAMYLRLTQRR